MEIKDMQCLVAIAEAKNVTRAAERLYITQPALSRTISHLEKELGIELLDHNARPIALTPAGEIFYEKARRILRIEESMRNDMERMKEGMNLQLSIEYGNAGHMPMVANALERFRRVYPNVKLSVCRQYNALALRDLKTRDCDLCIVNLPDVPDDKELETEVVCPESVYAFIPHAHPLSSRDALMVEDLRGEKLCIFERFASPQMFDKILDYFRQVGIDCLDVAQAPDTSTFTLMLIVYNMIGIMPKHTMISGDVDIKPVPIVGTDSLDIMAVWQRDQHNPMIHAFVDIMRGINE